MFSGFLKKKKAASTPYDPALKRPVIRCSICTGHQHLMTLRLNVP